ncbi:MAG: undecaprenyl-diphosphate phosphatase [Panacagrimonas sp.]|jgi:undecaprenyl-diphosphatase|nr:undecaprenyl-diphosphate phosphatase [Panacagrimonas sp.]MCC2658027.1 undecaprenyl-diphosphate phosphatase [Panacagrimonas sp.]
MNDLLEAILLGFIEGLTEFLPISSTGHLLIVENWIGRRSDLFNVAIQAGAILAVSLVYRARIWELATSLHRQETRDYALKLLAAFTITAALGLIAKTLGVELPETVTPVAIALIVGGVAILAVERHVKGLSPRETVTWGVAIAVGVAQVVAGVFPGTSRSAAAIFAAMLAGLSSRPRAAEFAFLVGIPVMFAATGHELLATYLEPGGVASESWIELGVAFVVAALTGFVAVKWLLRWVSGHSFVPFAWYRIVMGFVLLAVT